MHLHGWFPRIFAAALLFAFVPLDAVAEVPCASDGNYSAHDDTVIWPSHLQPGESMTIRPLANDPSPSTSLSNVQSVADPFGLGVSEKLTDGRTIAFRPHAPKSYPGDGKYLTYTASIGGTSAQAKIWFVRDETALSLPDFAVECDPETPGGPTETVSGNPVCNFVALPAVTTNVRSFDWKFAEKPECNKVDWRGRGTVCTFPLVGADGNSSMDITLTVNYFDRASASRTKTVTWTPEAPELTWELLPPNPSGDGSEGLSVALKLSCRTCNPCSDPENYDQLYFSWCDGCSNVGIVTEYCRGGNLAFPARVRHTYDQPGQYRVTAKVLRGGQFFPYPDNPVAGAPDGRLIEVTNDEPTVTVSASVAADSLSTGATVKDDVLINGLYPAMVPAKMEFDFGDGASETITGPFHPQSNATVSASTRHRYKAKGRYAVTVRATDAHGMTATGKSADVDVTNLTPRAQFTFNCSGLTCSFDAASTVDPDGDAMTYAWYLAGGSTPVGYGQVYTHTFATAGKHTVTLRAFDASNASGDPVSRRVSVTGNSSYPLSHWNSGKPCRLLDTRTAGTGGTALPRLTSGVVRDFDVNTLALASQCTVPFQSMALLLTVTVVDPTGTGYMKVWGTGSEAETSEITFNPDGSPRSNSVTVAFDYSSSGILHFKPFLSPASGSLHLIVDIAGVYTLAGGPDPACIEGYWCGPLTFRTIDQCRLFDTRTTPPRIAAGSTVTTTVAGKCGIPLSVRPAMALSMNVAAVPLADGTLVAYDSAYPSTAVAGKTATMTYKTGRVQNNGTIMRVGSSSAGHDLALTASYGATDAIVDVTGYFAYPQTGNVGLRFFPVEPCRAFDSRSADLGGGGKLVSGTTRPIAVAGNCGIPRGAAKAVVVNVSAVAPEGDGYLRLYASHRPMPATAVLNFRASDVISNGTIVELGTAQFDLLAAPMLFGRDATAAMDFVIDVYGYFAAEQ